MRKIFEKGLIKLVWIDKDINKIHSKRFDKVEGAEKFGKDKKHYIIFKLLHQKDLKEFGWEILPYGENKVYKTFLKMYKAVF